MYTVNNNIPEIYDSAAVNTTDNIMNTIAVHFQLHFDARPLRK